MSSIRAQSQHCTATPKFHCSVSDLILTFGYCLRQLPRFILIEILLKNNYVLTIKYSHLTQTYILINFT